MKIFLIVCFCLLLPGASLLRTKHRKYAAALPFAATLFGAWLIYAHAASTLAGMVAYVSVLLALHAGGLIYTAKARHTIRNRPSSDTLNACLVIALNLAPIAALYFYKVELFGVQLYYIPSTSMEPTIKPGDVVLADLRADASQLKSGDIIIFTHPRYGRMNIIKRVSRTHPNGEIEVLGDNPDNSLDSRTIGTINRASIKGKATVVFRGLSLPHSLINQN